MARPNITLRTNKGDALTYNEMDQNFSSFFYSASVNVSNTSNILRLHYSGSNSLDTGYQPAYVSVTLPTPETGGTSTVEVPGNDHEIVFNNEGSFGANSNFKFNNTTGTVSIGPVGALLNYKGTLAIQSTSTDGEVRIIPFNNKQAFFSIGAELDSPILKLGKTKNGQLTEVTSHVRMLTNKVGSLNFGRFVASRALLGQDTEDTEIIYQKINSKGTIFGKGNDSTGLVMPTSDDSSEDTAVSTVSIQGTLTIGSEEDMCVPNTSYINRNTTVGSSLLPVTAGDENTNGLLIQSPKSTRGGHVVIGLNTDSCKKESFSIVKGSQGTFDTHIASFVADGKVGIGTKNPISTLHVEGNITGSSNFEIVGNAYVKGKGCVETISEFAILETDFASSNDEYYKTVISSGSKGELQYVDASPVPKGGIIMWSGDIANMPKGWRLCDGSGTVNGVAIPDLRNKFIVGSTSDTSGTSYPNVSSGAVGGTTTISRTKTCELKECHLPLYTPYRDNNDPRGRDAKYLMAFQCSTTDNCTYGGMEGITTPGGVNASIGNSGCPEALIRIPGSCLSCHQIKSYGTPSGCQTSLDLGFSINNHLPPYYALAFIIYVGKAA